jgi:hypothetical protein
MQYAAILLCLFGFKGCFLATCLSDLFILTWSLRYQPNYKCLAKLQMINFCLKLVAQ